MRPQTHILAWAFGLIGIMAAGCGPSIDSQPSPIISPAPPTAAASDALRLRLEGLEFDAFLESSYRELLERDPELMLSTGLYKLYGAPPPVLTNNSDVYQRETGEIHLLLSQMLQEYDRDSLTPDQQVSYDVFAWYLDDRIRGQAFRYYKYPVVHFLAGQPYELIQFFEELHPLETRDDAVAYVERLSQVDEKVDSIIDALRLGEEAGVVAPRFIFELELEHVQSIANASPENTPFYGAFWEKTLSVREIGGAEREDLLKEAAQAIEGSVLPAFGKLADVMRELMEEAPTQDGVWQFPNGSAYYAYALRHHTTTDLSPDEVHEMGLQELERIHAEMRVVFDQLGYPNDESLPDLFTRLAAEGGWIPGSAALDQYQELIDGAEERLGQAFDDRPDAGLRVVAGPPTVSYYVPGSLDGSRPGVFYASVGGNTSLIGMPTLAYHEGVPGHHFQIALAQEMDLPTFRRVESFTAYDEGWALYAERLAKELGWYDGDPYGNLGRLQAEAFRAARLVADSGLHAKRWTFDEALDFMMQNTGKDRNSLAFEVSRYVAWPGQATAYGIGMLKILQLRQRAMEELGGQFDLKEFHGSILGAGSVPLPILERIVDSTIDAKRQP